MHLPRSVFSHRQLDLFLWLLRVNAVAGVPSVRAMTDYCKSIQKLCGVDSIPYDGSLGHKYYVNSLKQILQQVRPPRRSQSTLAHLRLAGNGQPSSPSPPPLLP